MKWSLALLCSLALSSAAELTPNRTVFVMTMNHSLDQFIANRLTRDHVLEVVTDPSKADTICTDRVGAAFEASLKEMFPPEKPKPTEIDKDVPAKETAAKDTPKEITAKPSSNSLAAMFGDTSNQLASRGSMGTGGRSHGTVFLVDVRTRQVLWSVFDPPKGYSPHDLDHTAGRIVKRLKEDLTPKKKSTAPPQ